MNYTISILKSKWIPVMAKQNCQQALLQSSVTHDPFTLSMLETVGLLNIFVETFLAFSD